MNSEAQTPLLNYRVSTDPAHLSTAGQTRVNIAISPATSASVYCDRFMVGVPVGPEATSLFTKDPTRSINTNKWSVIARLQKGSEISERLDADQSYATFTYECASSTDYLIDYNLVMGLVGTVNATVGDVEIIIVENSGTSPATSSFTKKESLLPLRKEPPEFFVRNLVATTLARQTVPCTEFPAGAPIQLAWESNGTYFQLFQDKQTEPVFSGSAKTCVLKNGVSRDTTFVLAASMTGSPGQDTPQGGYEPIYLYEALTVSVSNPTLTPASMAVTGALTVTGASTLGAVATGTLSASEVAVSGTLQCREWSELNSLTVVDYLSGRYANVSLLGAYRRIIPRADRFETRTDGFVIARVQSSPAVPNPRVTIGVGEAFFEAEGGASPSTITVPIPAGDFYVQVSRKEDLQAVQTWWCPIGRSPSGEQALLMPPDEELAEAPPQEVTLLADGRAEVAEGFVDRLTEALGANLPDDARADLAQLLTRL